MNSIRKPGYILSLIILAIVVVDQIIKIWVKTHFYLGEDVEVLPFFRLVFVENEGFAFGMIFGETVFVRRILLFVAAIALTSCLWHIVPRSLLRLGDDKDDDKKKTPPADKADDAKPVRKSEKEDRQELFEIVTVFSAVLVIYFVLDALLGRSIDPLASAISSHIYISPTTSKLCLTIFRLAIIPLAIWYMVRVIRFKGIPFGYLACIALIIGGAIGNIIDCLFYGIIFSDPYPPMVATMFPEGGGYAPFFLGKVVDMIQLPIVSFTWPEWVPLFGGSHFSFFDPIFNFADAAISVGVITGIALYWRYAFCRFSELKEVIESEEKNKENE